MIISPMNSLFGLAGVACLFVSAVVSISTPLPQYCLHDALFLSTHRACSTSGAGDLVSPIGQDLRPIYVDSHNMNAGNFYPWSYEPVCTDFVEEIGSQLCVYTNITFAGGRGISIFTTPRIAEEFSALLPFQDPMALKGINTFGEVWYTQKIPGKGTGMLANHKLERGDLITAYTPVLLAHVEQALSTPERERFLRKAVDQLPLASKEAYLNLSTIYGNPNLIAQDVLKANTFEVQVGGQMHLALFPETSRMNHDCGPNSQYRIDHSLLTHYVHAARPISRGEEITITYTNPFQPHKSRQQQLLKAFHFTCSCPRCNSADASDAALVQITSLQKILGDWSQESTATTKAAEKLIHLYKEQGLDSFLDAAYGYATLTYNGAGDAKGAKKYAKLAAEAVELKDGPHTADWRLWNKMMKDPKEHWSWRHRKH